MFWHLWTLSDSVIHHNKPIQLVKPSQKKEGSFKKKRFPINFLVQFTLPLFRLSFEQRVSDSNSIKSLNKLFENVKTCSLLNIWKKRLKLDFERRGNITSDDEDFYRKSVGKLVGFFGEAKSINTWVVTAYFKSLRCAFPTASLWWELSTICKQKCFWRSFETSIFAFWVSFCNKNTTSADRRRDHIL